MRSSRTRNFRKLFKELPQRVKETAKKNYELWKEKIWSVRVGIGWRALGVMKSEEEKIVWFWMGSHAEYDKILGKK